MWTSHDPPPPYYSNAMTLTSSGIEAQVATLQALAAALDRPWSVKDSFSALDLSPLGFRSLFDAEWIWTDDPDVATPDRSASGRRPVTDAH